MKCPFCGKKNKDGATTCQRCGAAMPKPALPSGQTDDSSTSMAKHNPPQKDECNVKPVIEGVAVENEKPKRIKPKLLAILIACAVVVIGVVVLVLYLVLRTGVTIPVGNGYTVLIDAEGAYQLAYKNSAVTYNKEDNSGIAYAETSIDHSSAAALTEKGSLYYFKRGECVEVAPKVTDFAFAACGRYIAYTNSDDGRLWLFDCAKNTPSSANEAAVSAGFVISPDGKSVLYNKQGDAALYVRIDKREVKIHDDMLPISVSKGGKYIYGYDDDHNAICAFINQKLNCEVAGNITGDIWLNDDHTQVMFNTFTSNTSNRTAYISIKGKEPVAIYSGTVTAGEEPVALLPVMTASTQGTYLASNTYVSAGEDTHCVRTCPLDTFDGRFYVGDCLVHYSAKDGKTEIGGAVSYAVLSDDCAQLCYISDGKLNQCKTKDFPVVEQIALDCTNVAISANGRVVWYIDSTNAIHYYKNGKDINVHNDVDSLCVMRNGAAIFSSGGSAFYCKNGKKSVELADGVSAVYADLSHMYILTDKGWAAVEKNGKTHYFN